MDAYIMRTATIRLVAGLVVGVTLLAPWAAQAGPPLDRPAPALVVNTLDGSSFDLAAHKKQVVLVNFWASWCPPCRDEMPLLNGYLAKHHAEGLELIGLSVDGRGDRRDVEQAMRPFSYPAALTAGAKANAFGAPQALPMTYVIDRAGVLRAALVPGKGALTEQMLDAVVLPLLAEQATPKTD
ncbi:MAG: TlpA disulfide reductase family protein [Pseudomonadota bacterium]